MTDQTIPHVEPDAAQRLAESGALLLDVREQEEWDAGHAPGAVHLPLGRLTDEHGTIPRDRVVVAVCRSGQRSAHATAALRHAGLNASNLAGGMKAWAAAGYPVVTDAGDDGQVI